MIGRFEHTVVQICIMCWFHHDLEISGIYTVEGCRLEDSVTRADAIE